MEFPQLVGKPRMGGALARNEGVPESNKSTADSEYWKQQNLVWGYDRKEGSSGTAS